VTATRDCPHCGAAIDEPDRFCGACGAAITGLTRPPSLPPTVSGGRRGRNLADDASFIPLPAAPAIQPARSRFRPTPKGWLGLLAITIVVAAILSGFYRSQNPDSTDYLPILAAMVVSSVATLVGWIVLNVQE
jgi:hypothetical protein